MLDASDVPGLLGAFPFPHRLELAIELRSDSLSISFTLIATGAVAVPVAFGWHPYFQLPQTPRPEWEIGLPAMDALELDAPQLPTGAEHPFEGLQSPLGAMTFDDAFGGLGREQRSRSAPAPTPSACASTRAIPTGRCSPRRTRTSSRSSR